MTKRIGAGRTSLLPALALAVAAAGCSLDDVLEVDVPGRVSDDALSDPALAQTLVNGVVGDLECAWNNYAAAASHHSDEWIPASGNLNMRNWGQRKITAENATMAQGDCTANYGLYTPLHTARFQGEDVYERLQAFDDAEVDGKDEKLATVRAYGGYALIGLGEGFCSAAVDGGPELEPAQVLAVAESRFDEAITLAQAAGNDDIANLARVGRARARLGMGDYAGAATDAAAVPDGYERTVSRADSETRRWNFIFRWLDNPADPTSKHGSIAPDYRDLTIDAQGRPTSGSGTTDTRVSVETRGELSFDFATIHWFSDKYTTLSDPVPLASWREARLIEAEVAARDGDVPAARDLVNELRTFHGLPTLDAAVVLSPVEMLDLVIEERRRELFLEAGHRLNDMLRLRGTPHEIPFLGEPGSVHPDGIDQTGAEYGPVTCWPLPLIERNGNENIGGSGG